MMEYWTVRFTQVNTLDNLSKSVAIQSNKVNYPESGERAQIADTWVTISISMYTIKFEHACDC